MSDQSVLEFGSLRVDTVANKATVDGQRLPLSPQEFQILALLARRQGSVVTLREMRDHLYGGFDEPELAMIHIFVSHMRKIMTAAHWEPRWIEVVWGKGYRLREPHADSDR